jgi:hypothetical protein
MADQDQRNAQSCILEVECLRRALEETCELRDRMDLRALRCRRQIADRHLHDHAAAQGAYPGHRGSPVSGWGEAPQPWQTKDNTHAASPPGTHRRSGLVQFAIQHAARSPKPRLGDPGYALAKDLPLTVAIAAPKTRNL